MSVLLLLGAKFLAIEEGAWEYRMGEGKKEACRDGLELRNVV